MPANGCRTGTSSTGSCGADPVVLVSPSPHIEFGNRLLTGALCAVFGRLVVAAHFLAAALLPATATATWTRVRRLDHEVSGPAVPPRRAVALSRLLLAGTAVLLVVGIAVTGSGPHAGDSSDVNRMPFDRAGVTVVHGVLAAGCLVPGGLLFAALPGGSPARRRTGVFLAVFGAQGAVGVFQSPASLPSVAVVLPLCGSALVRAGAVRVACAVREHRPAGPADDRPAPQLARPTTAAGA